MIKLENVSKYYKSKTNVTLGLSKINLEFNLKEFVAITGESGSGKSTLLNVISGIDTYEDGEMYFNNEETSYYDKSDWEDYRRNNISFVFQNYGLIDSYTVYENVVTAMIINNQQNVHQKALEIIEKVGLSSHIKHKGTKLSGGQKQRLAIARALAKDCNVLVADEPTGNLDSKTGQEIIKLLKEISNEKLVIMVTHNFEEVNDVATRKIRVFDGKIVEDIILKETSNHDVKIKIKNKNNTFEKSLYFSKLNIKSQPKRTIFTFAVTIFMTLLMGLMMTGIVYVNNDDSMSYIYNQYFNNLDKERVVLKKEDDSILTSNDYDILNDLSNVDLVYKYDIILDSYARLGYYNFTFKDISQVKNELFSGRMPENYNEVVIEIPSYLFSDYKNEVEKNIYLNNYLELDIDIVGIVESKNNDRIIYAYQELSKNIIQRDNLYNKSVNISFGNFFQEFYISEASIPSNYTNEDDIMYVNTNLYERLSLNETEITLDNKVFNVKIVESNIDSIYFSNNILDEIYEGETQYSLFLDSINSYDKVAKELTDLGYIFISPYMCSIVSDEFETVMMNVTIVVFAIQFMFGICVLGYLVLRLIFSEKRKDFGILKSIGLDKNTILTINLVELLIYFIISFIIVLITFEVLSIFIPFFIYTTFSDYLYLLLFNVIISIIVAVLFNNSINKKSVMQTIKEK